MARTIPLLLFPRCHRILQGLRRFQGCTLFPESRSLPATGNFPAGRRLGSRLYCLPYFSGWRFVPGRFRLQNESLFHVFLSCLRLQAPTALGFPAHRLSLDCLNQASAASDTFPIFTCPVGIIRLFKHFQTSELTTCQIDPPTGRKFLPIAPAAFRMPCFQMGLLHGFFFPAVTPAQPVMAAAFSACFISRQTVRRPYRRPVRSSLTYSTSPADIMGIMSYPPVLFFSLICKVLSDFWIKYLYFQITVFNVFVG